MNKTVTFLKKEFSNYYRNIKLDLPDRFTRREWGFLFIGESFMQRHIAFRRTSDITHFLSGQVSSRGKKKEQFQNLNVPAHVYYSSAYYQEPALQPMPAKVEGWLGADLIFDLDDDHLRNIEGLTPEERLKKVKKIVQKKLLDDFILGDLGIEEKFIKIAFSGSRGYHIHIRDPKLFNLSSAERREIVDYLTGTGLNLDRIFPDEVFETKEFGGKKYSKKPKIVTPKLDSPGWRGRMARGILELIHDLSILSEDAAIEELNMLCKNLKYKNKPIQAKDINDVYFELFSKTNLGITKDTFKERNILEIFSKDRLRDVFLEIVREHQKIAMAGETDEPVTTDVKRLIRLPTSLHGKTGFQVVPLKIDDLNDFDPFRDAIAFEDEVLKVKIMVKDKFNFRLGSEKFSIKPDSGIIEIPKYAGIYLLCQRKAELI
jgi:DNA primase small subunit